MVEKRHDFDIDRIWQEQKFTFKVALGNALEIAKHAIDLTNADSLDIGIMIRNPERAASVIVESEKRLVLTGYPGLDLDKIWTAESENLKTVLDNVLGLSVEAMNQNNLGNVGAGIMIFHRGMGAGIIAHVEHRLALHDYID